MRIFLRQTILLTCLLSLITALSACKDTRDTTTLEVHEIFHVEGNEETKKPTVLKYKDVKHYDENGFLLQQNFYEVDNSLKGYEFIHRDGEKGVTNYYSADSTLLAVYELEYANDKIVKRIAHDGQTNELLRVEIFKHDVKGNITGKDILDDTGALSSAFTMTYDSNGNEVGYSRKDHEGKVLMQEDFKISKVNDSGKWTERWGYRNGTPSSFHRRSFSK